MIELNLNDKQTFSLCENWDEIITAGKMVQVVEALLIAEPVEANKLRMLSILCDGFDGYTIAKLSGAGNAKKRALLAQDIDDFLAAQLLDIVFPCLDFIYSASHFYKNPLPIVKVNEVEYMALQEYLSNQTGEQWSIAYHAQVLYSKTNDSTHIKSMMAASYMPVVDGKAVPFEDAIFDANMEAFKDLTDAVLQTFYLWYIHADRWWMEKFPWIFPEADEDEDEVKFSAKPNDGMNIRNIVYELAGGKPTADWDVVKKRTRQDIIYALDRLEDKRIEFENAKSSD